MTTTTLSKRYFARNEDGSIKRKKPCQTEGCNFPNEHICLGAQSVLVTKDGIFRYGEYASQEGGPETFLERFRRNPEQVQKIREAALAKNQKKRDIENKRNFERDLMILNDFDRGMTRRAIYAKYHIVRSKMTDILERREEFSR